MFRGFVAFLALIAFLCTGCQSKTSPHTPSIRISQDQDFSTLDSRLSRDLANVTLLNALYEGLTRLNAQGEPAPALAESIDISPDQKTYTFIIRDSQWSDGRPVTAHDFANTWKSVLDPQFPAPNAYQFYCIKGAQAAKAGTLPLNQVGIKAMDDRTLVVELEHPTPYFLHLTASYFFYPVDFHQLNHVNDHARLTFNGPFQIKHWLRQNELAIIPNAYYWDHQAVKIPEIIFIVLDNPTAVQLFERGELDWMGSPLSIIPIDTLAFLRKHPGFATVPAAGTYWLRLNTEKPPFNSREMRQAFSLALNRQDLIDHVLQGQQIAALGIIPPCFIGSSKHFEDHDLSKAQDLFEQALIHSGLAKEDLPSISLCYGADERNHRVAQTIQQQWKQALKVDVQLQSYEPKLARECVRDHDYQISLGSWFADFHGPISFLEVFKFKDNGTNHTQWENAEYIRLLNQLAGQIHPSEQLQTIQEAEEVLIQDMPVIPLFYSTYFYVKQPRVKGVYFSEMGYLDFKHAALDP